MTLSPQKIERREFTFVSVIVYEPSGDMRFEKFIVSSPERAAALILAKNYVVQRGWRLQPWNTMSSGECTCCRRFILYPRNYIKKARELFVKGCYI